MAEKNTKVLLIKSIGQENGQLIQNFAIFEKEKKKEDNFWINKNNWLNILQQFLNWKW